VIHRGAGAYGRLESRGLSMKALVLSAMGLALAAAGCGSSNTEAPAGSTDGGRTDGGGTDGGSPDSGLAIAGLTPSTWTWVPVEGAKCRDGSATGIAVNVGTKTDKLMVYLEGGGACFNQVTCGPLGGNPSSFGKSDFTTRFVGQSSAGGSAGVFDRADAANPLKDWTFVYVPYCTGDVHAGNATDATVPGISAKQQFVGYLNVGLDLARVVPTFAGLSQVLLTGVSAGGFGAASNYVQVAKAFAPVPVFELDDSGPPMSDPYLPSCLQGAQVALWGLDKTILKDCGGDCPNSSNYLVDYARHVGKTYPNVPFGLLESTEDAVISQFFGFGADSCSQLNAGTPPTSVPGPTFTMGLADLRSKLDDLPNFGSFIFTGTQHTSIGGTMTLDNGVTGAVDTLTTPDGGIADGGPAADGGATVHLTDWISALLAGKTSNVGP
jgi:hypothetical protein